MIIDKLYTLNCIIEQYYDYILNESEINIKKEMVKDLKEILFENINKSNYFRQELNYLLSEYSFNIKREPDTILEQLLILKSNITQLANPAMEGYDILTEGIVASVSKSLSGMKSGFGSKHDKIVERDKKWLSSNKKKILELNFDEIELEVLSDYKITFEGLLNRHNIFDKNFVNSDGNIGDKIARFEDKNGNLKNGLDNYFRTGTSRREIGLRKVSGPDAKLVVENMIAYCESFISGRKFLEEKLNNILISINETKVKESYVYTLTEALEEDEELDKLLSEDEEKEGKEEVESEADKAKEEGEERGIRDRQVGIAVLLSVAEDRYFDYINILKGLME